MSVKFTNNGHSTLASSISTSDTSITVASGHGARFPSLSSGEYFYATLIDSSNNLEIVKCTARSSDVLTVTRAQESTTARAYAIGDRIELRVTAQGLIDATSVYDKDSSSTGYFDLPSGTTAQEPAAGTGRIRFDTDLGVVTFSDGTSWFKIAAQIAQLSSISGSIFAGAASTLTLTGNGFLTSNLVVNFEQSSDSIDVDVTVTPTSDTSASVAVPSSVYSNVTAGNVVSVQVTNSDGMSSAAVNTTAVGLPSGGTVSTTGSYRVHTFTSSGTLSVPSGFSNSTVEYLVVAGGGGGGGGRHAAGAGAGGLLDNVGGTATSISAGSYTITVGGGGSGGGATSGASSNGSNSSALSQTAIGGGSGGNHGNSPQVEQGGNGGSGGGSAHTAGLAPGSGTSGQGNAGSRNVPDRSRCPSGGGKNGTGVANGSGSETSSTGSGDQGGPGKQVNIDGNNYYYAGGGGGSASPQSPSYLGNWVGGAGGIGGGGGGASSTNSGSGGAGGGSARNSGANGVATETNNACHGGAGGANTGGGGGGAGGWSGTGNGNGGNGGSGIVIIRYQV